jgi:hypothetical protein
MMTIKPNLDTNKLLALMPGADDPYDRDLALEVLDHVSKGLTLVSFCRQEGKPSTWTVQRWRARVPEFDEAFCLARDQGHDAMAQECVHIAEDGSDDWIEREKRDGTTYMAVNAEAVGRSKLRIETRLKLLACWDRKRYGPNQQIELTGKDGAPVMDTTTRSARLAGLVAKLKSRAAGPEDGSDLA